MLYVNYRKQMRSVFQAAQLNTRTTSVFVKTTVLPQRINQSLTNQRQLPHNMTPIQRRQGLLSFPNSTWYIFISGFSTYSFSYNIYFVRLEIFFIVALELRTGGGNQYLQCKINECMYEFFILFILSHIKINFTNLMSFEWNKVIQLWVSVENAVLNIYILFLKQSIQCSLVAQSCPTFCDPVDCSMPDLPVHHQLWELAQTRVHQVGDAIQPSHPLSSPSPPAFNLSQQ